VIIFSVVIQNLVWMEIFSLVLSTRSCLPSRAVKRLITKRFFLYGSGEVGNGLNDGPLLCATKYGCGLL